MAHHGGCWFIVVRGNPTNLSVRMITNPWCFSMPSRMWPCPFLYWNLRLLASVCVRISPQGLRFSLEHVATPKPTAKHQTPNSKHNMTSIHIFEIHHNSRTETHPPWSAVAAIARRMMDAELPLARAGHEPLRRHHRRSWHRSRRRRHHSRLGGPRCRRPVPRL